MIVVMFVYSVPELKVLKEKDLTKIADIMQEVGEVLVYFLFAIIT